jgi:hypothetical protein
MVSMLLSTLAGFLASVIRNLLADRRQAAALKDLGRAQGEAETLTIIAEKADAQAKVNAAARGGASDVARRLRQRLQGPGGQ